MDEHDEKGVKTSGSQCRLDFKRAIFRIESTNESGLTKVELKKDNDAEWTHCLTYPKPIDSTIHTYFASGSEESEQKRRAVYLHSIKFYDNEEIIEGEDQLGYLSGEARDLS